MPRYFHNFLLLLASTGAALLAAELFLRLFFPVNPPRLISASGHDSWYLRNSANDIIGLLPDFRGKIVSSEFDVSIQLNHDGFRDQDFSKNLSPAAIRICILGDSFTFGYGVAVEETYGECLKKILHARGYEVDVCNLGVPGTGTAFQYRLFQNFLSLHPDIVILGMLATYADKAGNDLIDNLEFAETNAIPRPRSPAFHHSESSTFSAAKTQNEAHFSQILFYRLHAIRRWLLQSSHLHRRLEILLGQQFPRWLNRWQAEASRHRIETGWLITQQWLLKFQALSRQQNFKLILLRIPFPDFLSAEDAQMKKLIEAFAVQNDILVADNLATAFKKSRRQPRELYFAIDGHWRPLAHQVCGEALADFIVTKNLLRPPLHE